MDRRSRAPKSKAMILRFILKLTLLFPTRYWIGVLMVFIQFSFTFMLPHHLPVWPLLPSEYKTLFLFLLLLYTLTVVVGLRVREERRWDIFEANKRVLESNKYSTFWACLVCWVLIIINIKLILFFSFFRSQFIMNVYISKIIYFILQMCVYVEREV